MRERHREVRLALADAAQVSIVPDHLRQRNERKECLTALVDLAAIAKTSRDVLQAEYVAASLPADVAHEVANEPLRNLQLDLHERLEEARTTLLDQVFKDLYARLLKDKRASTAQVGPAAVEDPDAGIDHRVAE